VTNHIVIYNLDGKMQVNTHILKSICELSELDKFINYIINNNINNRTMSMSSEKVPSLDFADRATDFFKNVLTNSNQNSTFLIETFLLNYAAYRFIFYKYNNNNKYLLKTFRCRQPSRMLPAEREWPFPRSPWSSTARRK